MHQSPIRLYKIIGLIILSIQFFWLFSNSLFAYDLTNANEGQVYTSPKVDTSIPARFKPMNSDNLNDWLEIFPDYLQQYKSATQFIVIPAMGLIAPIVEVDEKSNDYQIAIAGKAFDYDKYLVDGPTIYPGTARIWEVGNTFLFGHSNYWIGKVGNFKTIFRLTYNIQKNDTILVFKKENSIWKKYRYAVTQSRLVDETEVSVMLPDGDKKEITLSACRPIGTARQRWINRATLIDEERITYRVNTTIRTPTPDKKQTAKDNIIREIENNQALTSGAKSALTLTYKTYTPWPFYPGASWATVVPEYKPKKEELSKEVKNAVITAIKSLINILKK